MNPILDWEVAVIEFVQSASPVLDGPFIGLTMLGEIGFFALALPLIYWCVDRGIGLRVAGVFMLSALTNAGIKGALAQPRPADYDASVRALYPASGYGLPSGHTQNAVVFWGWLAWRFKRRWFTYLAIALMVLIPLSRVYLGVHFPTDLVGGYIIGALLLWLAIRYGEGGARAAKSWPLVLQVGLALAIPCLLAATVLRESHDGLTASGTVIGLLCGAAIDARTTRFDSMGTTKQRVLRLLVGLVGMGVTYLVLKVLTDAAQAQALWRVVRYAALGLWVTWGAPSCFVALGLAEGRASKDRSAHPSL